MNYKIAQLTVSPEQKTDTISKIFISQPTAEQEILLGRLFIMVDLKTEKTEIARLINFIIDQIKQNYYHNDKIILLEKTASTKVVDIFESAITKLNQNIVEYLQTEKIKFSPVNVNISIGIVFKNELHFANLGRNKALLIYRPKAQLAGQEFSLMNINKKTADPTKDIFNINKLFSNIINGSIPMGSYFLFTNEALYEYLSESQLIKIITTLPPASAVEQIRNILQQTNVYVPFLTMIIQNGRFSQEEIKQPIITNRIKATQTAPLPNKQPIPIQTNDDHGSVEALHLTEEKTAELLNPTGFINFKRYKEIINRLDLRRWKKNQYKNKLTFKGKLSLKHKFDFRRLMNIGQLILGRTINIFSNTGKILTNKKKLIQIKKSIFNRRKRLQRKHWTMITVISLCIIALLVNLTYNGLRQQKIAVTENYQQQITTIKQKQDQINTNLIYDNLEGARNELSTIDQLLSELPKGTIEQQKKWQELTDNYYEDYDEINHITRLASPQIIANFSNEQKPDNMILVNGQLYLADNDNREIYEVDINQSTIKTILKDNDLKKLSQPTIDDNNNIYYLSNSNSIVAVDPSAERLDKLTGAEKLSSLTALSIFNNRIYIFDQQEKQIFRYNRYGNQLSSERGWLKDSSLRQINSLTIDGFVYLISGNQIFKYGGGRPQEFNLENISPALDKPNKIIALQNKEIFYVLEKENNRLIVFSKTGQFLAQYTNTDFDKLTDFDINERAGFVYILVNKKIYQIDIWQEE